ncbi:MAG: flagellar filament protein FlaA [Treponema sp.]|nr:flagellar filament protein FlaA [Treponema sp.]
MKKGVVILGGLLALAFCLPAVAQPSAKAVETIVIDNFDEQQDWSWGARASRFVAEGYPIVKTFEAMPNSLRAYHKEGDPEGLVLGTKIAFDRKGDNWFEVYPQDAEGNLHEIPFVGTVTQMDFWVWGANYNYKLEVLVRDADGRVHVLKAGSLHFQGWRNIVLNIPTWIRQHSYIRSGRPDMTFVGFRIRTDVTAAVDNYVIFFDQLKYTTNTLSNIYDGYELKDAFEKEEAAKAK